MRGPGRGRLGGSGNVGGGAGELGVWVGLDWAVGGGWWGCRVVRGRGTGCARGGGDRGWGGGGGGGVGCGRVVEGGVGGGKRGMLGGACVRCVAC